MQSFSPLAYLADPSNNLRREKGLHPSLLLTHPCTWRKPWKVGGGGRKNQIHTCPSRRKKAFHAFPSKNDEFLPQIQKRPYFPTFFTKHRVSARIKPLEFQPGHFSPNHPTFFSFDSTKKMGRVARSQLWPLGFFLSLPSPSSPPLVVLLPSLRGRVGESENSPRGICPVMAGINVPITLRGQ